MREFNYEPIPESAPKLRKRAALLAAALCALGFAAIVALHHTKKPVSAWQQLLTTSTPSHYTELLQQPEIRRSVNGVLSTQLEVRPLLISVGPVRFIGKSYEGQLPGPTLVLRAGDKLQIALINSLEPESGVDAVKPAQNAQGRSNHTNLHTHGLHISPSGVADNIYRIAAPGETLQYEYLLPQTHRAGTFYYHPHRGKCSWTSYYSVMWRIHAVSIQLS
jgi:FtsP/CotA-like multicopper oxidase with cupredoxin domain